MKIILLLTFFVLAFKISPVSASCDVVYENPAQFSKWLKIDVTKKTLKQIRKLTKTLPIDQKISLYEEMWSTLSTRLKQSNEDIVKQANEILKESGEDAAHKFAATARTEAALEYIQLNDLIVEDIWRELNKKGLKSILDTKVVAGTNPEVAYKYIKLVPDLHSTGRSSKKLARYQRLYEIEHYTLDLFENSVSGSRGFYQASMKRVDIGPNGVKSILIDDMPMFVVKHEGKHAGFARNRRLDGKPSVYDSSYIVAGDREKLTENALYARYMSAEELYNWSNDAYWLTERFRNLQNYSISSIIEDINHSIESVHGAVAIAKQTEELAEGFITVLGRVKSDIDEGLPLIYPLTDKLELASTIDEVRFLQVVDSETKRAIRFHIPQELRRDAQKIIHMSSEVNRNLEVVLKQNGVQSLADVAPEEIKRIRALIRQGAREQAGLDIANEYNRIFDYIIEQQSRLKTVASVLKTKNEELTVYLEKFVEEFHFARDRSGRDFLFTPQWQEKFRELRRRYREIGTTANEHYRGSPIYRSSR